MHVEIIELIDSAVLVYSTINISTRSSRNTFAITNAFSVINLSFIITRLFILIITRNEIGMRHIHRHILWSHIHFKDYSSACTYIVIYRVQIIFSFMLHQVNVRNLKYYYMEDDGGGQLITPVCPSIKSAINAVCPIVVMV